MFAVFSLNQMRDDSEHLKRDLNIWLTLGLFIPKLD